MAGFFSFLFSVYLYFVADEQMAGIFVGLWVPSVTHSERSCWRRSMPRRPTVRPR